MISFCQAEKAEFVLPLLSVTTCNTIYGLVTVTRDKFPNTFHHNIETKLKEPEKVELYHDFLKGQILYMASKERKEHELSFETFNSGFLGFIKLFKQEFNGGWSVPIVKWMCVEEYLLAVHADDELTKKGKEATYIQESVRTIQQMFSACQCSSQEPFPNSKLFGAIYCINILFKIFFKVDKIQQCKGLIQWVEQNTVNLKLYPKSVLVTYEYFAGRMALYSMNYIDAEQLLLNALKSCYGKAERNKKLILRYLIPVEMLMGGYCSKRILSKYKLMEYVAISEAVRKGNLRLFNERFEEYEELFINKGVYLIMGKLKSVVYRNLIKRVVKIIGGLIQIKLAEFQKVFSKLTDEEVDLNETECIIANLIYKGWIKGYISHEKSTVVLSKKEAFPKIRDVFKSNPTQ
jgi:hypothetical protein